MKLNISKAKKNKVILVSVWSLFFHNANPLQVPSLPLFFISEVPCYQKHVRNLATNLPWDFPGAFFPGVSPAWTNWKTRVATAAFSGFLGTSKKLQENWDIRILSSNIPWKFWHSNLKRVIFNEGWFSMIRISCLRGSFAGFHGCFFLGVYFFFVGFLLKEKTAYPTKSLKPRFKSLWWGSLFLDCKNKTINQNKHIAT